MSKKSNTSKRYSDEYKKDAVELVRSSGRTVADVARELGVSTEGLRGWVNQAKIDRGEGVAGALTIAEKDLRFNRSEQHSRLRAVYVARMGRPGMSDEMKADLWRRWRSGESISVISRGIGKPPGSVFTVLKHHGGIAPLPRKARVGSLTLSEREEISRRLCAGDSYRAIAALLGRAVSTVSREVNSNGGRDVYRAIAAQERSLDRTQRPKECLLAHRPALRQTVLTLLREQWSPEQIVGHLRLHHGDDPGMRISHETIYRSVYTTRWKVVPRELCKRLRTGRPIRKNKRHTVKGQWRSQIIDARPIEERPQAAEDRSESGHLEGDLVIGSNNSQVATLVDRTTRFLHVVKLASRHTAVVVPLWSKPTHAWIPAYAAR